MSNLENFLKGMREEGQRVAGGGSGIVSKVLVEFGLHRYVAGHEFWDFWIPTGSMAEIEPKKVELAAKLQAVGCTDAPSFGVRVTVRKEALSAEQPYKKDLVEFTPQWQADAYGLVEKHLVEVDAPIGTEFYAQIKGVPNPYHVTKGEAGKTDTDQNGNPRFPAIRVPVKKFANEAEARAFVSANGAANSNVQLPPFSDKAKANYPDLTQLQACANEINEHLGKAQQGQPFMDDAENYPLPTPPTPPNLKSYIANIYQIEATDIDLLRVDVPFG